MSCLKENQMALDEQAISVEKVNYIGGFKIELEFNNKK